MSIPDFMDKDKSSMIDATCTIMYAVIPMMLNYLLNNAMNLMNIFFIGMFMEMKGCNLEERDLVGFVLVLLLAICWSFILWSIWGQDLLLFVLILEARRNRKWV